MTASAAFPPRLMRAAAAARYLGVSEGTLRGLKIPRRRLGAIPVYDRHELDAYADALPVEGEIDTCAGKFGRAP